MYCDFDGLQAPDGGYNLTDFLIQTQKSDHVHLYWSMLGPNRMFLVKLTWLWNTDAKKAADHKYADLIIA